MIRRSDSTASSIAANGAAIPEAGVYITVRNDVGDLATLYGDDGSLMANPFQSGTDGVFVYNIADADAGTFTEEYRLSPSSSPRTIRAVDLEGDGGLRTDLAASTGSALIGTAYGKPLADYLGSSAMRPVRGVRSFAIDRDRAADAAVALGNPATTPMQGFAKYAGTTGGYGFTETEHYDPDGDGTSTDITVPFVRYVTNDSDDANVPGSFRWCVGQVLAKGGGHIVAHPRAKIVTTLLAPIYIPNNCTIAAPGRNWTIRTALNAGAIRFYGPSGADANYGTNIIVWRLDMKCESGGALANYDIRAGEVDILAMVPSFGSNKIWIHECTGSGATDGWLDIAGGTIPAAPVYYSVTNCTVRNTDKVMAVGISGYTLADAAKIFLTIASNHFDGCSERQPLCSGVAYIHAYNNVHDNVPHYRDYSEGSNISSVGAGDSRTGGRLLVENSIIKIGTTTAGMAGTPHQGYNANAGLGGAFKVVGTYKDAGVLATVDYLPDSVGALPAGYTYTAIDVLTDPVAARKTIIEAAGAGRTNWPDGIFAPVDSATGDALGLHVNGEAIGYEDGYFWTRLDERDDIHQSLRAVGYQTGAGGAVVQATSKSTAVTLNALCGQITMNNASLAAGTSVNFVLNNTSIVQTDVIIANIKSGATVASYTITVDQVATGSCRFALRNYTAGALAEAVVISFAVIKAVTA